MSEVTAVATKVQKVGGVTHWADVKLATTDTGGRAGVCGLTQQEAGVVWVECQVRAVVETPWESRSGHVFTPWYPTSDSP